MRVCGNCKRLYGAAIARCPDDGAEVAPVTELAPGTRVGQYEIVRPLGEGGMGMVYEGVHEVLGRRAAMKFLRQEWVHKPEIVTRFLQEAQAVNRIDHDGIINVYDYGDGTDGAVYFVMEFLEGETLLDFQHGNRPIPLPLLFHVYRQILSALAAAHAEQIVHRDLKPANVFLIRREDNPHFVKLLDFGVAKVMGEGARPGLTSAGSVLGTPEYMSPEQIAGRAADERSDIYSLGAMLYDAVVGKVPFDAKGFGALATEVLTKKITPPRQAAPEADIPEPLERLILKALARQRELRFQSVSAMLAELDAIAHECGAAPAPVSEVPAPSKPALAAASVATAPASARWKVPALIASAIAVLAIAAVVVLKVSSGSGASASAGARTDAGASQPETIASRWAAGDRERAREMARQALDALRTSDDADQRRATGVAMEMAASPAIADLLYDELSKGPQHKAGAARALARLGLPEAGPKLRAALQSSGGRLRLELAAALLDLGDRDSVAILERGLDGDARTRLIAAEALARAGLADKARPLLEEIYKTTPAGRARWLRAAVALSRLGDGVASKAARAELANPDPARSAAAAVALARAGDEVAITFLERVAADDGYQGQGEAALALARLGRGGASLAFVGRGLASESADERLAAASIAARVGGEGVSAHADALIRVATSDPDDRARVAALVALIAL